jgi:Gpi18-like mannosyltransferase
LTLRVCGPDQQQLAVLSCLLLAAGPASIHHAMPYSEALFTAASFVGLYCLYCCHQHLLAALAFAVSTATRSNGGRKGMNG